MNKTEVFYSLFLLGGVFAGSISQVMLKKASQKKYDNIIREYLNPLVFFAYIIFFGTTILSIVAYRGIPISMGPVLEATSYIYVTIWGVKIFGESINGKKILALSLIIMGILVYAFFG